MDALVLWQHVIVVDRSIVVIYIDMAVWWSMVLIVPYPPDICEFADAAVVIMSAKSQSKRDTPMQHTIKQ